MKGTSSRFTILAVEHNSEIGIYDEVLFGSFPGSGRAIIIFERLQTTGIVALDNDRVISSARNLIPQGHRCFK